MSALPSRSLLVTACVARRWCCAPQATEQESRQRQAAARAKEAAQRRGGVPADEEAAAAAGKGGGGVGVREEENKEGNKDEERGEGATSRRAALERARAQEKSDKLRVRCADLEDQASDGGCGDGGAALWPLRLQREERWRRSMLGPYRSLPPLVG